MVALKQFSVFLQRKRECSSVGRASASQAEGRGFEPRYSLKTTGLCIAQPRGFIMPWAYHIQGRTYL